MNDIDQKTLRRRVGATGWWILLYYLLAAACVMADFFFEAAAALMEDFPDSMEAMYESIMAVSSSAWGYVAAIVIGLIILLTWKKREFWREQIWARGRPMKCGDFLAILALFLTAQLFYQIYVMVLEAGLNGVGLSTQEGLENMASSDDSFSMFLYIGIVAPIAEEILFRGLILRTLAPYGKRFAIFASAFLFGVFHGNIFQVPFALLVGLVLGYAAVEHSIGWAIVLHMINNLVLADFLTRLIPDEMVRTVVLWVILGICAVAAVTVMIRRRHEIADWYRSTPAVTGAYKCFFTSGGVIVFTILMVLSMVATCFVLITPM